MKTPKIYSILPYYGKPPNYFQYYLDSVSINTNTLKVILITDENLKKYNLPKNVIHINLPIYKIRERISIFFNQFLNSKIAPESVLKMPYKLCDFRVIYGFLFKDILSQAGMRDCDYWGWSDCDLIYGNILSSIPDIFDNDLIGWHGHFSAIKNNPNITEKLLNIKNLKEDLLNERHIAVDEKNYRELIKDELLPHNKFLNLRDSRYDLICDIIPPSKDFPFTSCNGKKIEKIILNLDSKFLLTKYEYEDKKANHMYAHMQKRSMEVNKSTNFNQVQITSNKIVLV